MPLWFGNPWLGCVWAAKNNPAVNDAEEPADATEEANVDEFRSSLAGPTQTLSEVDAWYNNYILKTRTVSKVQFVADFQTAGAMKADKQAGQNKANPNGICGDATLFVQSEYEKYMPQNETVEGLVPGTLLWEEDSWLEDITGSTVLQQNHAATIMLPKSIGSAAQLFEFDRSTNTLQRHVTNADAQQADVLNWHVYDLWWPLEAMSLGDWWQETFNMKGRITIAQGAM